MSSGLLLILDCNLNTEEAKKGKRDEQKVTNKSVVFNEVGFLALLKKYLKKMFEEYGSYLQSERFGKHWMFLLD